MEELKRQLTALAIQAALAGMQAIFSINFFREKDYPWALFAGGFGLLAVRFAGHAWGNVLALAACMGKEGEENGFR